MHSHPRERAHSVDFKSNVGASVATKRCIPLSITECNEHTLDFHETGGETIREAPKTANTIRSTKRTACSIESPKSETHSVSDPVRLR